MKILSSYTHHQVVPILYELLCSVEYKGRYSEACGKQSSPGAPLTFFCFGSQWYPKTAWLQTFFRISSFVFSRTKKFIQVWTYLRWVNDYRIFIFGWTIPLNLLGPQIPWTSNSTTLNIKYSLIGYDCIIFSMNACAGIKLYQVRTRCSENWIDKITMVLLSCL